MPSDTIHQVFSNMTNEERVGQLMMPAISELGGNGTHEMDPNLSEMLSIIHPGGVILFSRDIDSPSQLVTLTDSIQRYAPVLRDGDVIPLFIALDQEGGYIVRLPFGPRMPGNMALGAAGSPNLTYTVAKAIGNELSSLGINMNFAPVLDVETNQNNPVIGIRSFGGDPTEVSINGISYIEGMHDSGIICSGKHFPGHGDVDVDSHLGLPLQAHNKTRIEEVELVPFKAAIENGVDAIMTAHIIFPAYDNSTNLLENGEEVQTPATLSKPILTDLLREELGFEGLIITDAMMMKAISDNFGVGDATVRTVRAGADIILYPEPVEEAYSALFMAYETDPEIRQRVDESVIRILSVKEKGGILPISGNSAQLHDPYTLSVKITRAEQVCLGDEMASLERHASEQTVTLLKDDDDIIPISLADQSHIVLFSPSESFTSEMNHSLMMICEESGIEIPITSFYYPDRNHLNEEEQQALSDASLVLFGTLSSNEQMRSEGSDMVGFTDDLLTRTEDMGIPVIGLALNQPYDIMVMPDIPVYYPVFAGKPGGWNVQAAIHSIFGLIPISGKLPVTITDNHGTILYPMGSGIERSAISR